MRRLGTLLATTTTALALVAGCTDESKVAPPTTTELSARPIAALVAFDACDDYLSWIKQQALDRVGPWGLDGAGGFAYAAEDSVAGRASAEDAAGAQVPMASPAAPPTTMAFESSARDADGTATTGTNNQEAGVDEADLVKTDGRRVVTVQDRMLVAISIDGVPALSGTLDLGMYAQSLFLVGDRAYVLGTPDYSEMTVEDASRSSYAPYQERTRIAEVDLSGAAPTLAGAVTVDGSITAGRLADGVVRLVMRSSQPTGLGFVYPRDDAGTKAAEAQNRTVIEQSGVEAWLPSTVAEDGTRTPLVDCADMYRPHDFSGFSTLTVVSISDGLGSLEAMGLAADAGITYASPTSLYVATTRYPDPTDDGGDRAVPDGSMYTDVHRFGIDSPGTATYVASGRVEGTAINQYAMSEYEGRLRIATTTEGSGGIVRPMPMPMPVEPGAASPEIATTSEPVFEPSSSRVTILETSGDALAEVGKVVGLGPTERIQGVRFEGDRGYVVTFRQTDPLYVLDLADPTAPKVLGELKVTGFSDYLHPIGDGLVLGVGVEATDQGRRTGAKIALYDTGDPTNPVEIDRLIIPGGSLNAGSDPHAFTWDAERRMAAIIGNWYDSGKSGNGAIVVRVGGRSLVEVGRLVHDPSAPHAPSQPGPEPAPTTTTTTTTEAAPTTTAVDGTTTTEAATTTAPATTVAPTTTAPSPDGTAREERSQSGGGTSSGSAGVSIEPAAPQVTPVVPMGDVVDPGFAYWAPIMRTFVVNGRLWALSGVALSGHDPLTLAETAWVPFR